MGEHVAVERAPARHACFIVVLTIGGSQHHRDVGSGKGVGNGPLDTAGTQDQRTFLVSGKRDRGDEPADPCLRRR